MLMDEPEHDIEGKILYIMKENLAMIAAGKGFP